MPKFRAPSQLARDSTRIAELYLNGLDQNQIAAELSISQSKVSERLKQYHEQWIEQGKVDVGQRRAEVELKLRHIYKLSIDRFETKGYPGHLKNAISCLQGISKLHGLDKDVLELTGNVGINSFNLHQAIQSGELEQAKIEVETWRQDVIANQERATANQNPLGMADNSDNGTLGQDSEEARLVAHSEAIEASKPAEPEPPKSEVLPDNYLSITDPNSDDFPLTI